MTITSHVARLPDPDVEPAFYEGVMAKRGLAWAVDLLVIAALTVLAGLATLTVAFFFWPVVFLTIGFVYRVATIASGSATWGMRLMGIELRGQDGARFDVVQAVLHVGGYYASWAFVVPAFASMVAMAVTARRQGLTDLLLGSAAINRPA